MKAHDRKVWDISKTYTWVGKAIFRKNDSRKNCGILPNICGMSDLYWPANVNGKKKRNIFPEFRNQIISATLKTKIAKKQRSKGASAKLKELLRYLFHVWDAERISFRHRSIISAPTTKAPYWGRPGLVIIVIALEEIALEETALEEIILEKMLLSNIKGSVAKNIC